MSWGKFGLFAGGFLAGTAGIAILTSKDAKNLYTHCTAAVLRAKDSVLKTTDTLKENCSDIYEDASDINDKRKAEAEKVQLEKAQAVIDAYKAKHEADAKAEA